jgi:hypothetical protein
VGWGWGVGIEWVKGSVSGKTMVCERKGKKAADEKEDEKPL